MDHLKAHLVAKGYNQQKGVDYLDTFSPVIRLATIHIVLTLATVKGWSLRQLDVKNAFLHRHLDTTIFMDQPLGFVDSATPTHVCLLKRALYGLKQAPRAWFDWFSSFLIDFGFFCSSADSSLFIYKCESHILILLVYVDDIILTGSSDSLLAQFVSQLAVQFSIKDLGSLNYFLGIQVCRFSDDIFLSQSKYMTDILTRLNMVDCKPVATPMASKRVSLPQGDSLYSDLTEYRRIVGTLQYLTLTRPNLNYAVNTVCQYMHAPTMEHFQMVKRILCYVNGTCLWVFEFFAREALICLPSLMRIGLATPLLGVLPPVFAPFWALTVFHGVLKSNQQFLVQARRLNIVQWPPLQLNLPGFLLFCVILASIKLSHQLYFVIISLLFICQSIRFFILASSTLPLTITLFRKKLLSALSLLILFHLLPN